MMLERFIAKRIYQSSDGKQKVSRSAVRIAMIGIALGLAVMIVSMAVVVGFKNEIREKIVGFGAHIQLTNFEASSSYNTLPVIGTDSLLNQLKKTKGVRHAQRYSTKPTMIRTDSDFQGAVLKGVGQEYDWAFFNSYLVEGSIPRFTDSVASNQVLISKQLAAKLQLSLGDPLYTYFIQEDVRARKLIIKGIYQTNFSEYDELFIFTDLYAVNRLNNWKEGQVSGVEVYINQYDELEAMTDTLITQIGGQLDVYGNKYYVQNVVELNPKIFAWLELLDMNIWVIFILMIGVAGFTVISGLLILILERTNMIGILKALGATNRSIREIFLYVAFFLIGKGMLWGNLLAISFCVLQAKFKLITLDPTIYFIDAVPIELNITYLLLINLGTLILSLTILIGPSYLVTRIYPSKAIRFE